MTTEPGSQRAEAPTRSAADDLACIELVELVTDYLEGALPDAEHARVDRHLAGCTGCTRYVAQMRATIRASGRLTPDDVPEAAVDDLLAIFRSARGGAGTE